MTGLSTAHRASHAMAAHVGRAPGPCHGGAPGFRRSCAAQSSRLRPLCAYSRGEAKASESWANASYDFTARLRRPVRNSLLVCKWIPAASLQRGRACGGSAAQGGRLWVRVVGSRQFRWARHSAGRMSVVHAWPESHSQHISLAHGRYPGSDHIGAGRVRLPGGSGGLPHKEALNGALSEPRTPALA